LESSFPVLMLASFLAVAGLAPTRVPAIDPLSLLSDKAAQRTALRPPLATGSSLQRATFALG